MKKKTYLTPRLRVSRPIIHSVMYSVSGYTEIEAGGEGGGNNTTSEVFSAKSSCEASWGDISDNSNWGDISDNSNWGNAWAEH